MRVQFAKEQLTFTGEDTAMATLLLSMMGAFAEFERSLIRERQREGIALPASAAPIGRARALTVVTRVPLQDELADKACRAELKVMADESSDLEPSPLPADHRLAYPGPRRLGSRPVMALR